MIATMPLACPTMTALGAILKDAAHRLYEAGIPNIVKDPGADLINGGVIIQGSLEDPIGSLCTAVVWDHDAEEWSMVVAVTSVHGNSYDWHCIASNPLLSRLIDDITDSRS